MSCSSQNPAILPNNRNQIHWGRIFFFQTITDIGDLTAFQLSFIRKFTSRIHFPIHRNEADLYTIRSLLLDVLVFFSFPSLNNMLKSSELFSIIEPHIRLF